jgi:polyisoprenyl-phosphate glycosyltransferase
METRSATLISAVLPAFEECEGLPAVISSLIPVLAATGFRYEIIVVDDGSADNTRGVMLEQCERHPCVRYIRLSRNFGKEAALSAGLKAAEGDAVILMDSDGQHPPSLIPVMIEKWKEGYEAVAAVQDVRSESSPKRLARSAYYFLLEAGSKVVIPQNAGDFRLLARNAVDAINALPERNRLMKGLYAWVGFRTALVPYKAKPRIAGVTKYSWFKLFGLGFTGLTSFTVVPLRAVSLAGLIISATALFYGFYLLIEHYVIEGDHVPGWATLAVGMMFSAGVQLLALGVIAEYLGRTFEEAKQRPIYIVAEDTKLKPALRAPSPVYDAASRVPDADKPETPAVS